MQGNLLVPFLKGLGAATLPGYSARESQQCGFLTRLAFTGPKSEAEEIKQQLGRFRVRNSN